MDIFDLINEKIEHVYKNTKYCPFSMQKMVLPPPHNRCSISLYFEHTKCNNHYGTDVVIHLIGQKLEKIE